MARLGIVKVRGEHDVNAYILSSSETGDAVVIDPAAPAEKLLGQLGDLQVRWIVATHGHPGHVAAKDEVKQATGATTAMHMADAKAFLRSADRYLLDGEELAFGPFKLRVLATPGHTPGSLCFVVGNHLFTGDTLLAGGLGKQTPETDLRQQLLSIGTRLREFSLETAIYPGHGAVTNLATEVQSSPVFRRS
ncbi:MAG: MBL fold metallo-hydrolase [Candidatus Dormibacteraeota bacterium]|nr:MBL fold metallo-hydrolase [Candidatus Dormibacteraeota bacterium]MBO0703990.1 MBL fold metallo-hydrolase [Candidatus Dormibacteraeota bacterium]MBO0760683.1 MBL fold metallo-hydrolase [Candidatus Dormibacteraeota bacterium]